MYKIPDMVIGVDSMQEYYDNLVIMHKMMEAEIQTLGNVPSICTHKKTRVSDSGITYCSNKQCRKIIDGGTYDCVR